MLSANKEIPANVIEARKRHTKSSLFVNVVCGIYKITSPSGKIYIGQSSNIYFRWHHYKTGAGKRQMKLNASFNKYGVDNHKFEILQECEPSELNSLEKYYVDLFQTFSSKHGLNIKDGGGHKALRKVREKNILIDCACGCGNKIYKYDAHNRERKYISGHNNHDLSDKTNKILSFISIPITFDEIFTLLKKDFPDARRAATRSCLCKLVQLKKISRIKIGLYAPIDFVPIVKENPIIFCECGCGKEFLKYDRQWRERRFISGHNAARKSKQPKLF